MSAGELPLPPPDQDLQVESSTGSASASSPASCAASGAVGPATSLVRIPAEGYDERGRYVTIEHKRDEITGQLIKITNEYQVRTIVMSCNRNVLARRARRVKFGDAASAPPGPEKNVTMESPIDVVLDLRLPRAGSKRGIGDGAAAEATEPDVAIPIVRCHHCGLTGHFSLRCPLRRSIEGPGLPPVARAVSFGRGPATTVATTQGRYVPPSLRGGSCAASSGGSAMSQPDMQEPTLRVTNLSEDTTEDELGDLFSRIGGSGLTRVYVARDRQTNLGRGFAFVTYRLRKDAERAIVALDGRGLNQMIMRVEWARPRTRPQ
jgi:translation initiation factor 3 subunit G